MKPLAAFAAIAAWFLYFAHGGLQAGLSGDDLMNLYGYLQKPAPTLLLDALRFWSTAYRPLGALFYIPLYKMFGMNPLPYRIACFIILGLNLVLLYRFCARLANSREIAFLAAFLASYHAWFVDLYYSAGTIYDLLCYSLYMSAFLVYAGIRAHGRMPGARDLTGIALLYVLALDAKEMAVSLPLFLLLYEVIFHGAGLRKPRVWIAREARAVWITGAIALIYVAGKLTGPGSLIENPAYALTISPCRYLKTFHLYLNPLLYQEHWFHDSNTAQLPVGMLAFAVWRRSRVLLFAWFWILLTLLPVSFIAHYAAFFEYLPAAGWALYAATLLAMARRALVRLLPRALPRGPVLARTSQTILFLGLAAFLAPKHAREAPKTLKLFMSVQPPTREITEDLLGLRPALRRGARILFVDDPFPKDSYFLLFLTRLLYRDMTLDVERTQTQSAPLSEYSRCDAVFQFRGGRLTLLRPNGGPEHFQRSPSFQNRTRRPNRSRRAGNSVETASPKAGASRTATGAANWVWLKTLNTSARPVTRSDSPMRNSRSAAASRLLAPQET